MRVAGISIAALVVTSFVACADLQPIAADQCGNRIVEGSEDCDTFAAAGGACRPPGSAGACHYDCSGSNACPPTYECGAVDSICRRPTGTFDVENATSIFAQSNAVAVGDFDGDGRSDAVTSGGSDARVQYFGPGFVVAKTLVLPTTLGRFTTVGVGSDTNADIAAVRSTGAIDVFRGQSDRTLAPVVYSSLPIPNTKGTAHTFIVRNQITNTTGDSLARPTGDDVFAFGSSDKGVGAIVDLAGRSNAAAATGSLGDNSVVALPARTVDQIAGDVAIGSFVEGSVCDQFAFAFTGDSRVDVYSPCRATATPNVYVENTIVDGSDHADGNYQAPTHVSLPLGASAGIASDSASAGAFAVDANGDGHLDLLIAGTVASAPTIFVTFGTGTGSFSSSPTLMPVDDSAVALPGIGVVLANAAKKTPTPLAVADLNGDKVVDYVFPDGIFFSVGAKYVAGPVATTGSPWTSAAALDLNHDGILDVAAANPAGTIDVLLGTGTTAMSELSYGLDGVPTHLVAGDFDGDSVGDVAFAVTGVIGGVPASAIDVMFGRPGGFPDDPASQGSLPSVLQIAAGPLTASYTGVTAPTNAAVSSMIALSVDASTNVFAAVLVGSPTRVDTSSFSLFLSATQRAIATRIVSSPFVQPGEDDLMMVTSDASDATKFSVWLAPSTGAAVLDSTTLRAGPTLPDGSVWTSVALIPSPTAKSNAVSQGILLAPTTAGQLQGFVVDPSSLGVGAPVDFPCTYAGTTASVIVVRAVDFDGDGLRDLLVSCPDASGKLVIMLAWNDVSGPLAASRITIVPTPSDPVVSTAYFRAGAVVQRSVAMLTANGLWASAPGGADGRTFAPPTRVAAMPGGTFVNTGDFDGDGVADLVIVDSSKTIDRFFRGTSLNDVPVSP